jgi:hypothetical protein
MTTLRKVTVAAAITAFVAVGSFFGISISASNGAGARALEGSWQVRLTPGSDTPQFDELITFAAGGGIVESNNFPFVMMGLSAGPGHGTWRHTGGHNFQFSFLKFLFTPDGFAAGTLKAAGTITYSPVQDTWSGPAKVSICDNQGANCFQIDVTHGQATRIVAGQ